MTVATNLSIIRSRIGTTAWNYLEHQIYRDKKIAQLLVFIIGILRRKFGRIKLMPIEWLDENVSAFINLLEPEAFGNSYGPLINNFQKVDKVLIPAVKAYLFENVNVTPTSSTILAKDKIIIERVKGVDVQRCNYASGQVLMHGLKKALVFEPSSPYLEKGFFLGGNGSWNYYHWMIEILPKLQYLEHLEREYDNYPLLVSDDVQNIQNFRESLNCFSRNRPIIALDKNKTYRIGKLLYINSPNNLPFNYRQKETMKASDFLIRNSSIEYLRKGLYATLDLTSRTNDKKRLFFARKNQGREYNQEEIFELLRCEGFKKVYMEDLSIKEQIDIVSDAEFIAGPTGAAWTNLIFCNEKSRCLCWMAEGYGDFSAFSNLAKIVGVDLQYITYKREAKSIQELNYVDYHLDAKDIQKEIMSMLDEAP